MDSKSGVVLNSLAGLPLPKVSVEELIEMPARMLSHVYGEGRDVGEYCSVDEAASVNNSGAKEATRETNMQECCEHHEQKDGISLSRTIVKEEVMSQSTETLV